MDLRHASGIAFLGAATLLLAGCGPIYQDFTYVPNELDVTAQTNLKIAVVPFADRRETFDRGSHAWAWLPLVPFATESSDRQQDPRERWGSKYYFPDLVAYGLALDLRHNQIGSRVDIAPPALEDYDLIVHGTLDATSENDRRISYGLGPLRFLTAWIALPRGSRWVDLSAHYVVYDAAGTTVLDQPIQKQWISRYWGDPEPFMHGQVTTLREASREIAERLLSILEAPPFSPEGEAIKRRVRQYHARLDPEILELLTERDRARGRNGAVSRRYAEALDREIKKRGRYLEVLRRLEEEIIGRQQEYLLAKQQARLAQIARRRTAEREVQRAQEKTKRARSQAITRSLAAAVVAGVTPSYAAATSYGGWQPQHWETLTQDLGAALAAMPPPPPPPPDLGQVARRLRIDMRDFPALGTALSGLKGNNLPEIRARYLKTIYAKKTRSLGEIRQSTASR